MHKGFTLIELVIVITIIAILYGVILFSVTQYINKGKDSNILGNLAILVPAGEVFYNGNSGSYSGFCNPTGSSGAVLKNALSQMPPQSSPAPCYTSSTIPTSSTNNAGVCCKVATDGNSWAACARKFTTPANYYCVDSRGVKEEVTGTCSLITQCP